MSSYSFSHQFCQHWTQAPEPIRAAIVQELTDIATLLQTDTPFEKFVFSLPDLDSHLDDLYAAHEIQQIAATEGANQQALEQIVAEQQLLAKAEAKQQNNRASAEKMQQDAEPQHNVKQPAIDDNSTIEKTIDKNAQGQAPMAAATDSNNTSAKHLENHKTANVNGVNPSANNVPNIIPTAINFAPKNLKSNLDHEALIHELGMHIDDYLSEQMAQLSEDLKSWLRAEISRQLADQGPSTAQAADNLDQKNT